MSTFYHLSYSSCKVPLKQLTSPTETVCQFKLTCHHITYFTLYFVSATLKATQSEPEGGPEDVSKHGA